MAAKKMSFEEAVEKLEEVKDALNNGHLTLEESSALYEQSLKYYDTAVNILNTTKQKIEMLNPENNEVEDFE